MPNFNFSPAVKLSKCSLYKPGHAAHPIQARVEWTSERVHEVELVEFAEDAVVVRDGDQVFRLLNHNVGEIRAEAIGEYQAIYATSSMTLLTFDLGDWNLAFSVKPDDGTRLEPCPHGGPARPEE